jgi:hypothetical protein
LFKNTFGFYFSFAPSKRWHVDQMIKVLTAVSDDCV